MNEPLADPVPARSFVRRWLLPASGLLAGLVALALRKPWALHTPQLWAEDGSIFLTFNDLHGLRAFTEPYMGYLHTIPRLTAWLASVLVDPAWWPAFYNWAAFLGAAAVITRTFSARLQLPGKPWLALAFFLGPQTGEVLFTITNLQWITAVLLIEQAFVLPPRNAFERTSDLLVLALIGVTGPFVIAFWPLLAWRWWRDRTGHDLAVLIVATACAVIQGQFVLRTGPHFDWPPFDPTRFFAVLGQRLVVWPLLGREIATRLPAVALGLIGLLPAALLLGWSLRPHPLRRIRATLVAAFFLVTAALVYRSRPDSWSLENIVFGDRYFYIPRLMLFWLLILEFQHTVPVVRWTARAAGVAIAAFSLKGYSIEAPPDYHWAQHCEPIRRGVPANIPTLPDGWTLEYRGRPGGR